MPPQLISIMNHRGASTAPAESQHVSDDDFDDGYHDVHEYKRCMEGIRSERPDLSTGAMRQIALRLIRCKSNNSSSEPSHLLGGVVSRLRTVNSKGSDRGDVFAEDEIGLTVGSSRRSSDLLSEILSRLTGNNKVSDYGDGASVLGETLD